MPHVQAAAAQATRHHRVAVPALPPALALISLVLGLYLLADGLREQSLKD